jgi:hypothetical protein
VSELTADVLLAEDDPVRTGSLCAHAERPPQSVAARATTPIQMNLDLAMSELAGGFMGHAVKSRW